MKTTWTVASLALAVLAVGCVGPNGNFEPPDPIGRAIFRQFSGDRSYAGDREYVATDSQYVQTGYYQSYQPQEYVVTVPPPRRVYERRTTVIPGGYRDPVWVDGDYYWTGSNWQWMPGRYVDRPRPGMRWSRPTFYTSSGQRYYRSGYWR
jgi:hypothetical protein